MKSETGNIRYRLFIIPVLLFFLACGSDTMSEKRAKKAAASQGDIIIGIVRTSVSSNFFQEGVNMAVEEINQRGGVLGKKIRTIIHDDMKDPRKAEIIAEKLAGNDDLIAVIGHGSSNTAIPVSVIYEKAGIIFISYGAKDPDLTLYSGKYTFRNIPTQKNFGHEMARLIKQPFFMKEKPLKRVLRISLKKRLPNWVSKLLPRDPILTGKTILKILSHS